MPGLIEPFVINQEDTDVTQADGTADALQDLMLYRVPIGIAIILRPEDVLCIYVEETDASAAQATAQIKVEIRDATGTEKRPLLGPLQYASFSGEFQDEDKLIHLDIAHEVRVVEQEYIAIMGKNPSPYLDKDTAYFSLRCHRER